MIDKILWPICVVFVVGAVVLGSYKAGQIHERNWWRQELAAKSAVVAQTIQRAGAEAENLDDQLVSAIRNADAQLSAAERDVRELVRKISDITSKPKTSAAPDDPCRPVPAVCLRASR